MPPASELEALTLAVLHAAGIHVALCQVDVGDDDEWIGRVDFRIEDTRVIIEAQSIQYHTMTKLDVEADIRRLGRLAAAGYLVIPVTWAQLTGDPAEFVANVRKAIRAATAA